MPRLRSRRKTTEAEGGGGRVENSSEEVGANGKASKKPSRVSKYFSPTKNSPQKEESSTNEQVNASKKPRKSNAGRAKQSVKKEELNPQEETGNGVSPNKRPAKEGKKRLAGKKKARKTDVDESEQPGCSKALPQPAAVGESDSSESEWEEVEMGEAPPVPAAATEEPRPKEDIQITIGVNPAQGKKEVDAETMLRREINRYRKKQLEEVHKAHLLGYIAHGRMISSLLSAPILKATAMSLIPVGFVEAKSDVMLDPTLLKKFLKWFQSAIQIDSGIFPPDDLSLHFFNCIQKKTASSERDLVALLVVFSRSLGLDVRLMCSVHPCSFKVPTDPLVAAARVSAKKKPEEEADKMKKKSKKPPPTKKKVEVDNDNLPGPDYWAEVYLDSEERWLALDPLKGIFDEADKIETRCKPPVSYVLGFDNESAVRDLTTRYSSGFLSPSIRAMRCDHDWWVGTLRKFRSRKHPLRDRLEDMQLQDLLLAQPLPTTLVDLKGHPLYVLKKDLRKFEAIYPPETKRVGYVRGMEVFPRDAVHTLRCKETWIKDARVIRVGEEPFKIVKARPKLGIPKEEQQDRPLPLFGFWQTEPYIAKPAVDGKIPRNQYGNVDLFKPEMLPPGTVHLPIPGLLSVAKKLGVDCAPAMVGWDFTGRGSYPVFNGWVVCEEHKEALLAAWDHSDALEAEKRAKKKSARALENWRKMTRGLVIKAQLERKYRLDRSAQEKPSTSSDDKEECDNSMQVAWPQSQQKFTLTDYETL